MRSPERKAATEAIARTTPHRDYAGTRIDEEWSPHGGDVPPVRAPLPTMGDRLEAHGRVWTNLQKIVVGVVAVFTGLSAIGAGAYGAFVWAVNRAVESRFEELYRRLDPMVLRPTAEQLKQLHEDQKPTPPTLSDIFNELRESNAKTQAAVDAPNNPHSVLGAKLSALDATLRERLPPRPNKPALPSVGPAAKAEGRP